MTALALLLFLFLILFFLSRSLTRIISGLILHITKSQKVAVSVLSLLFFPGTVVHEVAHFLMANILFVRAGNMVLIPRIDGDNVRLGSVSIEKTDPIRRMLIGVAPFLLGTAIIFLLLFYAGRENYSILSLPMIMIGYIVFEIGNTMFSSKRDLEGVVELLGAFLVLGIILYFLGVRLPESFFQFLNSPETTSVLEKGSILISVPIVIDGALIAFLYLIKKSMHLR